MIRPIQNISFAHSSKLKTKKIQNNSKNCPENFKSIYKHNICFTGFINSFEPDFQETLDKNYFQLPQVHFKDGSTYQLRPDKYQFDCAKALYQGKNLAFIAPTGTGKTAVAHYIITKNLKRGKKTIYTSPLKALANDKLREFRRIYGKENVGLLTGSTKINTNAPIQIMTTEIYNNQSSELDKNSRNIGTVIFDEAHYISDPERGNAWENAILSTPFDKIQTLYLTATIGNGDDFINWLQSLNPNVEAAKVEVNPEERFVPLKWLICDKKAKSEDKKFLPVKNGFINTDLIDPNNLTERQKRAFEVIFKAENDIQEYYEMTTEQYKTQAQSFKNTLGEFENLPEADFKEFLKENYPKLTEKQQEEVTQFLTDKKTEQINKIHTKHLPDSYPDLVSDLKNNDLLPALIFKLSRKKCEEVVQSLKDAEIDLTSDKEKQEIEKIIDEYRNKGKYLGTNFDKKMLLSGYAYHHAGILPQYKELIEELFSKKLLKTVVATSTLSAGINMPARTVVISDTVFKKFNPLTKEIEYTELSANDFHQMTGRAGRRGVDSLGYVVLYNLNTSDFGFKERKNQNIEDLENKKTKRQIEEDKKPDELSLAYDLIASPADKLRSHFRPDWTMLAKYYENNTDNENLKNLIASSFKVSLSLNPEKEERSLLNKFENYKIALLKQGFLEKNNKNQIFLTPKGKILTQSQGLNPLVLASLIYDEKLKGLEIEQLCQIASYIAGSSSQEESDEISALIDERFKTTIGDELDFNSSKKDFDTTRKIYKETEDKILKSQLESRVPANFIMHSNSFWGYCGYLWAYLNNKDNNSISNFRKITGSGFSPLTPAQQMNYREATSEYTRLSSEGNVHNVISQTVSILKQISKICDFALEHADLYPNQDYYNELKENAELALIITKQNPIYDETNLCE